MEMGMPVKKEYKRDYEHEYYCMQERNNQLSKENEELKGIIISLAKRIYHMEEGSK